MPKLARYLLAWSKEDGCYELRERGENTSYALREDDARWSAWLEEHRSFAFQGKQGHLNLLKEARARGSEYWYAYRSQNRRTSKRYAGRTADITFSRLEELAGAFMREVESQAPVPAEEPLLEPKLHAPRLQAALVARERLFARMQSGLERKLTLLCAPAGSGKTTLAGQWLNERRTHAQMLPVAWIALDNGDNDPIRFWRYVITACQRFHPGLGRALLAQLSAGLSLSFELPSLETVLTPLLNEMARVGCSGILILEDYHLITEARIHETLIFFLDYLPENMHVVVLTRSEPPFPLARWRARGELCEVLAADLRFSQEESASFFQQVQISPAPTFSEEALRRLNERVEGWAAGLRLLALALQGSTREQEFESALANFTGDQRSLQEYFVMEVLNAQPETLQNFLLRTSVISRLTGSLCDAVVERHGSARLLESVERAGLFLELLDGSGGWYRYHALFAEAMRVEARRRLGNDAMRLLYLRASQWYAQ
ncbi:MAG: transcriptional regulator, partial [Ktedonobacteraceae bacterium]|nr:transcriptional regulator [Ktedonobacteraceae bacterium]